MAVLSVADRQAISAKIMRDGSSVQDTYALLKTDLRAAVDAADAWVDANAASYNSALPLTARGALTVRQKALLLAYVILRRYEVS